MLSRAKLLCLLSLSAFCSSALAKTITASGGSSSAVQSAIDSASDGDTVLIPAGNFSWSAGISVKKFVKVYGAGMATVINQTGQNTLVDLSPSEQGSVELGKLKFTRSGGANGIFVHVSDRAGTPALVHDIAFENVQFGSRAMEWGTNGGVIYDCSFVSADKSDNSGIAFKNPGSDSAWHEPDYMGMADSGGSKNTYLEDCTFKDMFLQALDFDDNSRVVMRHCRFEDSAIASHGQETSAVGARQWECYGNEFIFSVGSSNNPTPAQYPLNMNYFLFIRGGGPGACFDNKIPDISSSAWGNKPEVKFNLYNIRRRGQVPCQIAHPAAHQIGWGINAQGVFVLDPVYFWGNTGGGNYRDPALEDYNPDECGNNLHTADFVKKNREYYVETPKPGYEPYTYPHPLRGLSEGGATPTPTPVPSATPSPTPTPKPPVQTWEKWIENLNNWIRANPPTPDQ